jgi:hypothetical protein
MTLCAETVFWNNLLLLGFDSEEYEKKYQMQFNRDMFQKVNVKGMEIVMFFLIGKIEQEPTKTVRRLDFPLHPREDFHFRALFLSHAVWRTHDIECSSE